MENFKDYIFLPKIWMMTDDGVFIGTRDYLFCVPSKIVDHQYRKITTTKFSFKGKEIKDAIKDIINESSDKENLEQNMLELKKEFPEMMTYSIKEIGAFKVQAGMLGSGIHVNVKGGKFGYRPFIQKLGKEKTKVKEFYLNHPKLR